LGEIIYYTKSDKRKEFTKKILEIYKDKIGKKVFIKPNHVSWEEYPATTHPDMLRTVITWLQNNGREITIGDGHGVDVKSKKVQDTTIRKICKEFGLEFLDLYKNPKKIYKTPRGRKVKLSKIPFESDSIISLPILKTHPHWHCHMTGALKMVVGYMGTWERMVLHMLVFKNRWKTIAEANWILMNEGKKRDIITIMDAFKTLIHANEFRHGGEEVELGYLLASNCPVVLDIHGFNLLKEVEPRYKDKDLDYVPYIKYAKEYGICDGEFELKEVL